MKPVNLRMGLLRLSALFLIPWSAYWSWVYIDSGQQARYSQSYVREAYDKKLEWRDDSPNAAFWLKESDAAVLDRDKSFERQSNARNYGTWGFGIFLLVVWGGYWVARGFMVPKTSFANSGGQAELGGAQTLPPRPRFSLLRPANKAGDTSSSFDSSALRKKVFAAATVATFAEFFIRSVVSGGKDKGTNVLVFLAIALLSWAVGKVFKTQSTPVYLCWIGSAAFLIVSLLRYV